MNVKYCTVNFFLFHFNIVWEPVIGLLRTQSYMCIYFVLLRFEKAVAKSMPKWMGLYTVGLPVLWFCRITLITQYQHILSSHLCIHFQAFFCYYWRKELVVNVYSQVHSPGKAAHPIDKHRSLESIYRAWYFEWSRRHRPVRTQMHHACPNLSHAMRFDANILVSIIF